MTVVSRQIFINAPLPVVWAAFSDIDSIGLWRSSYSMSRQIVLTEATTGVGAKRRFEYDDGGYSVEEVVEWNPPHGLVLRTTETNFTYQDKETTFRLEAKDAGTLVTESIHYSLPGGLFGVVLDFLSAKALHRTLLKRLLKDLKKHIEAGRLTNGSTGPS